MHKYFEIDFPESTAKKAAVIKKNKAFTDIIGDPDLKLGTENMLPGLGLLYVMHDLASWPNGSDSYSFSVYPFAPGWLGLGGTELYSKDYCLLSGDLREFTESIVPKLKAQGFDTRYVLMAFRKQI